MQCTVRTCLWEKGLVVPNERQSWRAPFPCRPSGALFRGSGRGIAREGEQADLVVLQLLVLPGDGGCHSCVALLCVGGGRYEALLLSFRPAALLGQSSLVLLGIPGCPACMMGSSVPMFHTQRLSKSQGTFRNLTGVRKRQ